MKKLLLSSVVATTLLVASEYDYEITPLIGQVDTKEHVDIKNHKVFGIALAGNLDESSKFDQLEVSLLQSKRTDYKGGLKDTTVTLISVNGIKDYKLNEKFKLYALAGLGYEGISDTYYNNESDPFFDYGVGAAYSITKEISVKLDIRHELKFDGDKNVIYTLGLGIPFGKAGSIKEMKKEEPTKVEEKIVKKIAVIPKKIELDSDNDGVVDSKDTCPSTQNGIKVDMNGCELDSDKDGIVDSKDQCSFTKEGVKVDANGCTIIPLIDTDSDGVLDSADQCPKTETGVKVDHNGCQVLDVPADLGIIFETNSDKIKNNDVIKFQKYVTYLKKDTMSTVIIEAHTDSRGSAQYNLNLSQKRAESAKKLLISMGIESNRIKAIGYGETNPIVSNDTADNREKNRRVTARIEK